LLDNRLNKSLHFKPKGAHDMNDFQNAHETGKTIRRQEQTERSREISAALDAGRFAVVGHGPAYCPFTDATTGTATHLIATFATREAAEAEAAKHEAEEIYFEVLPRLPQPARPAIDRASAPF
jgi:hypothetical protein